MYNWFCQFMSCGKKVCIIFDRDHAICLWLGVVEPRLFPEEGMGYEDCIAPYDKTIREFTTTGPSLRMPVTTRITVSH